VLFPVALMVADSVRRVPALQALAVAAAVAVSHFHELLMFTHRLGEP